MGYMRKVWGTDYTFSPVKADVVYIQPGKSANVTHHLIMFLFWLSFAIENQKVFPVFWLVPCDLTEASLLLEVRQAGWLCWGGGGGRLPPMVERMSPASAVDAGWERPSGTVRPPS